MINRITFDPDGRSINYELNMPIGYLEKLVNEISVRDPNINFRRGGPIKVPPGVPVYTGVAEYITQDMA